jgi:hypothetical protein
VIVFKNEALGTLLSVITWVAPTQNVDGTTIDYELNYIIYVNGIACKTVQVTEYQLSAVQCIQDPGSYTLAVSAYPRHVDIATSPDVESDLSNNITILVEAVARPKAPTDLSGG